jgi:aldehyde:ferredoxin oxidoreductase
LGAIMGAKNLKGIVVKGTQEVPVYNPDGLKELQVLINKRMKKGINFLLKPGLKASTIFAPWLRRFKIKNFGSMSPSSMIIESYKRWGTAAGTAVCVETGDAPVKNWTGSYKDFPLNKSVKITSDNVTKYQLRRYACNNCPIGCGGIIGYKDDRYDLSMTLKPEYETLAMLGSNILNDDLGSIYAMNDYCNRQGLDTIAVGAILGMLMEAKEKDLINNDDLDGLDLNWGSTKDLLPMMAKITKREGIGDILADGIGKAAKKLGIEDYAIHIKNQAIPAHDPRFSKSMVIPYRLDPAPGRHTPFMESEIELAKFNQMYPSLDKKNSIKNFYCYKQVITSLGLCEFGLIMGNFPVLEAINLVTGIELKIREIIRIGERILTLKHLFNLREDLNPLNNQIPIRILDKAIDGPNKNTSLIEEEEQIIKDFLKSFKWDVQTTQPQIDRLKELGLEDFI